MKSIRLNQQMRQAIIENMVSAFEQNWFSRKPYSGLGELDVHRNKIKEDIMISLWDSVYGQYLPALNTLPDFFLRKNSLFSISGGTNRYYTITLKNRPGKDNAVDILFEPEDWDLHFAEVISLIKEEEEYKKNLSEFKIEIKSIIESVSTTKQLVELWSNAEEFIPATLIDPNNINLPAINVSQINAKLGLSS